MKIIQIVVCVIQGVDRLYGLGENGSLYMWGQKSTTGSDGKEVIQRGWILVPNEFAM